MPVEETVPVTTVPESKQHPTPKGIQLNCPYILSCRLFTDAHSSNVKCSY